MKRYFNILVGPMSSGKTTFANRFWPEETREYYNLDDAHRCPAPVDGETMRESFAQSSKQAWSGLEDAVYRWFSGDKPCFVLDGLLMQRDARAMALDSVIDQDDIVKVAWFLDTPISVILKRFRERVDSGEFEFGVPKEAQVNQCLYFELPSDAEPFDAWIRVPISEQEGQLPPGADPLEVMAERLMFVGDNAGRPPKCDFLDEAASKGSYHFRDMNRGKQ